MANDEPIVLELAPLPREQIGPFVLLGLDKDADADQIEEHWARRVVWARKNQIGVALQDINWAREVINDIERRVRADVASLNADTLGRALREVAARYGVAEPPGPVWAPIDIEKPVAHYTPPADIPDAEELRRAVALPEIPWQLPAAERLLEHFVRQPLDPWEVRLPEENAHHDEVTPGK